MALFVSVCVVRAFIAEGASLSFDTGVQDASHNMAGTTAYTPTQTFIGSPFVTDRRASERAAAYMNPDDPLPDQSQGGFGSRPVGLMFLVHSSEIVLILGSSSETSASFELRFGTNDLQT